MQEWLFISFYIILFSIYIYKNSFFEFRYFPKWLVLFVFYIKVGMGIFYGFVHSEYYPFVDTFIYFSDAEAIYKTILKYPDYYWRGFTLQEPPPVAKGVYIFPYNHDFFASIGTYINVYFHAFLRIFSFGYYNIHIIFLSFLGTLSSLFIYKALRPTNTYIYLKLFFIVFLPSLIFWTSGLHKDGMVYLGLTTLFYYLHSYSEHPKKRHIIYIYLSILLVISMRTYLLVILLPNVFAYLICLFRKKEYLKNFLLVNSLCVLSFVVLNFFSTNFLLEKFVSKQKEFTNENVILLQTKSNNSAFSSIELEPSYSSILINTPKAFINAFFRPFLTDCFGKNSIVWVSSLEVIFIFIFCVLFLFLYYKNSTKLDILHYFLLFYAIGNLLFIGFLVNNSGTMVRYRCIALSFICIFFSSLAKEKVTKDTNIIKES